MCVWKTQAGIFVRQRARPIKYLSARACPAHMCAHSSCIIPLCSTARASWKTEGEYFQTTERQIKKKIFPCHTVRALFPGSIPLALHYCTLSAVWNHTSKLHHQSDHNYLYCRLLKALFTQVKDIKCCIAWHVL